MADVQGLGHVGSAVVDHDGSGLRIGSNAEALSGAHGFQIGGQPVRVQPQIQKAGLDGLDLGEGRIARQGGGDRLGDLDGRLVIGLGSGHRAVALVFTQIGPV